MKSNEKIKVEIFLIQFIPIYTISLQLMLLTNDYLLNIFLSILELNLLKTSNTINVIDFNAANK